MAIDVRELLRDAAGEPTEPVDTIAILRRAGRRRRSMGLLSIAALVVAGAAVVTIARVATTSEDPGSATRAATDTSAPLSLTVEIERSSDLVTLRLLDASAAPIDVERELHAAGIDVTVSARPGGPTLVGTWADNTPDPQPGPGLGVVIEDRTVMRLPVGYTGQLAYYRPAQPGETDAP